MCRGLEGAGLRVGRRSRWRTEEHPTEGVQGEAEMPGVGLLPASVQSPQALTVSHVMGILKINFLKK